MMRSFSATATCLLPSSPLPFIQPRHSPCLLSVQRHSHHQIAVNDVSSTRVRALGDFSPSSGASWKAGMHTRNYVSSIFVQGLSGIPNYSFKGKSRRKSVALVRCEQASGGTNDLSLWLGRIAMLSFVGVVSVEIITGKGVLEQLGINSPAPIAALALTAAIGTITAVGIFRSAKE